MTPSELLIFNNKKYFENIKIRFFNFITKKENTCWEWKGACHSEGYGQIMSVLNRRPIRAHRLSYIIHTGIIKDKNFILHKCDNKKCVNPKHLFEGTHTDNMRDMIKKGRDNNRQIKILSEIQRSKTHCPRGHEYTEENIYRTRNLNDRKCRKCHLMRYKNKYSRRNKNAGA